MSSRLASRTGHGYFNRGRALALLGLRYSDHTYARCGLI